MNCPFHILIYRSRHAVLPRAAAAAVRVRHGVPLREVGRRPRPHAGRGHDAGRRPHLLHEGDRAEELASLLDFVLDLLRDYGLDDFYLELSTKPPGQGGRHRRGVGGGHRGAAQVASKKDLELVLDEGGGAFYGPKISVQARDAIGRTWQMSTIQLDFQTPQRFELEYVGADNERHRPIMIHRALFGSIERFFGVLVEHYAGAFPAWLARCRCGCCRCAATTTPTPPDRRPAAAEGFRADVVEADETLGAGSARPSSRSCPTCLVVGDDDVEAGTVGVNARGCDQPSATSTSTPSSSASPPRSPPGRDAATAACRSSTCGPPGGRPTSDRSSTRTLPTPEEPPGRGRSSSGSWPGPTRRATRRPACSWRGEHLLRAAQPVPVHGGHLMVLPNRAVAELEDLDADEHAELWATVPTPWWRSRRRSAATA